MNGQLKRITGSALFAVALMASILIFELLFETLDWSAVQPAVITFGALWLCHFVLGGLPDQMTGQARRIGEPAISAALMMAGFLLFEFLSGTPMGFWAAVLTFGIIWLLGYFRSGTLRPWN